MHQASSFGLGPSAFGASQSAEGCGVFQQQQGSGKPSALVVTNRLMWERWILLPVKLMSALTLRPWQALPLLLLPLSSELCLPQTHTEILRSAAGRRH